MKTLAQIDRALVALLIAASGPCIASEGILPNRAVQEPAKSAAEMRRVAAPVRLVGDGASHKLRRLPWGSSADPSAAAPLPRPAATSVGGTGALVTGVSSSHQSVMRIGPDGRITITCEHPEHGGTAAEASPPSPTNLK